jgi:methyl-accepting chemotaxis protein WspA
MKNLTLRQRMLASFAVILGIMASMAALNLTRLVTIEREADVLRTDSVPGLFYSASLRSTWGAGFIQLRDVLEQPTPESRRNLLAARARFDAHFDELMAGYDGTLHLPEEAALAKEFRQAATEYRRLRDVLLADESLAVPGRGRAAVQEQLLPQFTRGSEALVAILAVNKKQADIATASIASAISNAEKGILVSLCVALVAAVACGLLLMRAITQPMGAIVSGLTQLGAGDLSRRLDLARKDEFNAIQLGFNTTADELSTLVSRAQRSAIQVATSITEVAATSKQQQATANEIAATTTEIGATAKEISATSNELVRTMNEVSTWPNRPLNSPAVARPALRAWRHDAPRHGGGQRHQRQARDPQREGRQHQPGRDDHHQGGGPDQPAVAERGHRGGEGRPVRSRLRGGGDRDPPPCRPDRRLYLRHRADGQGHPVRRRRRRHGHGQVLGGGSPRHDGSAAGRRPAVGDHRAGAGLVPRFEVANEGMQAQATGAGQISDALSQLSEAAQQTVESLQQFQFAIDELNQVSNGLRSSISRFKLRA